MILRGGKEAAHSSLAIVDIVRGVAITCGLPTDAVQLVATQDREAVGHFLSLSQYIDLAIPRGGEGLIRRVSEEATMPVIKHFHGNCHVYIDQDADLQMAEEVAVNSKCQRMGVCNAAESILVHRRYFCPDSTEAGRGVVEVQRRDSRRCSHLCTCANRKASDR